MHNEFKKRQMQSAGKSIYLSVHSFSFSSVSLEIFNDINCRHRDKKVYIVANSIGQEATDVQKCMQNYRKSHEIYKMKENFFNYQFIAAQNTAIRRVLCHAKQIICKF